ncbi:UNVERIFIED_CONTAM: hypothetical protein HHA_462120 [Hammondia hammondi]|eukprot:XP_008884332.1 hypothetical protein HHA_462120 [Hammondia hammondi]
MQRKETEEKDREDDGKNARGEGQGATQLEGGRATIDSGECTSVNVPQSERRNKRATREKSPEEERSKNAQKARRMQTKDEQTGETKRRSGTDAPDRKEKNRTRPFEGWAFRKKLKERKREETERFQTSEAETRRQASSWQQEQSGDRVARQHTQERRRRRAEDERSITRATERKNEKERNRGRAEGWRSTAGDEGSREERRRRMARKRTTIYTCRASYSLLLKGIFGSSAWDAKMIKPTNWDSEHKRARAAMAYPSAAAILAPEWSTKRLLGGMYCELDYGFRS